jgi:hypothetical protein
MTGEEEKVSGAERSLSPGISGGRGCSSLKKLMTD